MIRSIIEEFAGSLPLICEKHNLRGTGVGCHICEEEAQQTELDSLRATVKCLATHLGCAEEPTADNMAAAIEALKKSVADAQARVAQLEDHDRRITAMLASSCDDSRAALPYDGEVMACEQITHALQHIDDLEKERIALLDEVVRYSKSLKQIGGRGCPSCSEEARAAVTPKDSD